MKRQTGIWIDTNHAYIIELQENQYQITTIDSEIASRERIPGEGKKYTRVGSVYIDPEKKEERRFDNQLSDYLEKVKDVIRNTEEVVIFGPAQTKKKLAKMMQEDKKSTAKLLGSIPADAMTKNQMVAWVIDFYSNN
jgi:stalled ribosome rescue protein Dom34